MLTKVTRVTSFDIKFLESCTFELYAFVDFCPESSFECRTVERGNVVCKRANVACERGLRTCERGLRTCDRGKRGLRTSPANFDFYPKFSFKCSTVRVISIRNKPYGTYICKN